MWEVEYNEKGQEFDYKRIDRKMYLIARSYFKAGSLYYFRINEFSYVTIADEDIISIAEL